MIIKELEVEHLIARDGTPRGLMMHFLVPKEDPETSLFFDDALQDFVGSTLPKKGIDELKKRFLPYLKNYYQERVHETERVNTKDKPCLYDSNGTWRMPTEFAFKIDEDLEVIGYHNLHSDFSKEDGWEKNILANIGVVDRLEFDKLEKAIRHISKESRTEENDRSILKILMLGLEEKIGDREDWESLFEIEWIPTRDDKRRKTEDALLPNTDVEQIIGECELGSLIDGASLLDGDRERWSDFSKEDLDRIGIRGSPTFEELIMVWVHHQKEELEPPLELFDELERNLER